MVVRLIAMSMNDEVIEFDCGVLVLVWVWMEGSGWGTTHHLAKTMARNSNPPHSLCLSLPHTPVL